jgi:hypothetical protein
MIDQLRAAADALNEGNPEPFAALTADDSEWDEQLAGLEYRNGRSHMCTITTTHELSAGAEFEMFGRSWRVVRVRYPRRDADPVYLACVTTGKLATTSTPHSLQAAS